MTIQQLTYLLEVYKSGSFSLAAQKLYITQSAISNAVISLEKEIGAPIFVRSKKGLIPTARGLDVINHAKRACDSIEQITAPRTPEKKSVRIGCTRSGPASEAFLQLLEETRDRKDIEFAFVSQNEGDFLERLLNHELDIVFFFNITNYSMGRLENVKKHNLDYEIFAEVPAVVKLSPKHPLYNKPNIDIREFARYRMLLSSKKGLATAKTISAHFPIRQENILPITNSTLRAKALEEGYGFTLTCMPLKSEKDDHMRYIPIEGMRYTCYYVTNPNAPQCEELHRYIELFKNELTNTKG
ncbi:MAG: LysR family transcriptional regulator [Oscillospiraceae bacterium]|nr:LysR family transcriptional regulator [Oscillospiraceae bacterium]